jgi:hypothetical protein
VKAGIGKIECSISDAKAFGIEFGLLGDDLSDQPTDGAGVRFKPIRKNLFVRDVERRQNLQKLAKQRLKKSQIPLHFLNLRVIHWRHWPNRLFMLAL